jgi:hypothetical protein
MKKYLISNESILPDDYDRFIYDEIKEWY